MTIIYTYKITSVDEKNRCMEVEYSSKENPTMLIGTRLPYQGETVEDIIKIYSPVRYWEELNKQLLIVNVGQEGEIIEEPPIPPTKEEIAINLRNSLLLESDWTQLADVPLTSEQKNNWAIYRQELRDITSQSGFPDDIIWPIKPEN